MNIKATTLRPGVLVSLKTSVIGNVRYEKQIIEREHVTKGGAAKARWETERTIADPDEHERATKTRSKAASLIRSVCAKSAFGLLCPENAIEDLEDAIEKARQVADAFNETAKLSRVHVYVITGRIAPDDVEAVRAINSEVRDLLEDMRIGVKNLDADAIRDAANRARSIGTMLSPGAAARVADAIAAARGAARQIVKAGETAEIEIDRRAIRQITDARTAFLDLEDEAREIARPKASSRAIDLAPPAKPIKAAGASSRTLELD